MSEPLPARWLDSAISHATTQWLNSALRRLLPQLVEHQVSSSTFAHEISNLLKERKLIDHALRKCGIGCDSLSSESR